MDSGKKENSKPPYPILCNCCKGVVCYSLEKSNPKLNIPVFCDFCCSSIEKLYEHYFKSDRFDLDSYKWKFDYDTDKGRKNHSAMSMFAVHQSDIYWALYSYINEDLSDLTEVQKRLLELYKNDLPINKPKENT